MVALQEGELGADPPVTSRGDSQFRNVQADSGRVFLLARDRLEVTIGHDVPVQTTLGLHAALTYQVSGKNKIIAGSLLVLFL